MTEHTATDRLTALERARAQIEIALGTDRDWTAFRQAGAGPDRLPYEQALVGNPIFTSWLLLGQAIGDLKAKAAQRNQADRTQRMELHHILEHIRNNADLRADPLSTARERQDQAPNANAAPVARVELPAHLEPAAAFPHTDAAVNGRRQPRQEKREEIETVDRGPGSEGAGIGLLEPEEATVTFVIRERVGAVDDASGERDGQVAPSPADEAAAAGDAPCTPQGVVAEEAEVVIVPRPAGRSVKPARP